MKLCPVKVTLKVKNLIIFFLYVLPIIYIFQTYTSTSLINNNLIQQLIHN